MQVKASCWLGRRQASALLMQSSVCKKPLISVSPALLGASLVALVPELPVVVRMPCASGCCAGSVSPAASVWDSANHQLLHACAVLALVSARCFVANGHKIPCSMLLLIIAGQLPGCRSFLTFLAGTCIDRGRKRAASAYPLDTHIFTKSCMMFFSHSRSLQTSRFHIQQPKKTSYTQVLCVKLLMVSGAEA